MKLITEVEMKTNQGEIVQVAPTADHSRIRAVLREWGYKESEIQRFLKEPVMDQKLETRRQHSQS